MLIEDTKNKIAESALICIADKGLLKVTLNDIAKQADVSRPTVYSYFKDKNEIMQFALLQAAFELVDEIIKHVEKFESPRDRVLEAMLFSLKRLPQQHYLALIADPSTASLINEYALVNKEGNVLLQQIFKVVLNNQYRDEDELNEIIEVCTRMLLSLLTLKPIKARSQKEQRAFLERRLLSALDIK